MPLFRSTFEEYEAKNDVWWALRSLQELGWWSEAEGLLRRNERETLESGDHLLLKELYAAKGDVESYHQLELKEAQTVVRIPEAGAFGFIGIDDDLANQEGETDAIED